MGLWLPASDFRRGGARMGSNSSDESRERSKAIAVSHRFMAGLTYARPQEVGHDSILRNPFGLL